MSTTGRPTDRTGRKLSTPAALFDKVLQAFANGDTFYADVQSDLERLLATGASPEELREVLRRCDSIEPLPRSAHGELLSILTGAVDRGAADIAGQQEAKRDAASAAENSGVSQNLRTAEWPAPPNTGTPHAAGATSLDALLADRKSEYEALMHAYERARDAGSTAAARTVALTADLAAVRNSLEAEQRRSRDLDRTLTESIASEQAAREREEAVRLESYLIAADLRAARESLAVRDTRTEELGRTVGERDGLLALLQTQQAVIDGAPDLRESVRAIEAELNAERARSFDLTQALAEERSSLTELRAATAQQHADLAQAQTDIAQYQEALVEARAAADRNQIALVEARAAAAQHQAALVEARAAAAQNLSDRADTEAALEAAGIALAEARTALECEQSALRETDKAWADAVAAVEAARALTLEARQQAERAEAELQAMREGHATPVSLDRDLQTSRVRAAAVAAELTSAYSALEAERSKSRMLERALADKRTAAAGSPASAEAPRPAVAAALHDEETPEVDAPWLHNLSPERASVDPGWSAPLEEIGAATAATAAPAAPAAPAAGLAAAAQGLRMRGNSPFGLRRHPWGRTLAVLALGCVSAALIWFVRHRAPAAPAVGAAPGLPGAVFRDCAECPVLTVLPAGRYRQGSEPDDTVAPPLEKPAHWVTIARPLAVSTNAVTVNEYRAFVAATGRDMRGCDTFDGRWHYRPENNWEHPGFAQSGAHPVTCVSWNDATAYAAWISKLTGHPYRLPGAAEWEYAARAGNATFQPWHADGPNACASANLADQRAARKYPGLGVFGCDDGYAHTAPVGSFKANAFGLNDMLGNVFQWTEDCWHADYTGAAEDGSARTFGDCSQRELRGGSWLTAATLVRPGLRGHFAANYRASTVGIRLIRDLES